MSGGCRVEPDTEESAPSRDVEVRSPAASSRRQTGTEYQRRRRPGPGWTFLTNHAHVLLCLAHAGSLTARELSLRIGITERSVQAVLADLVAEGYLDKTKVGRRNDYSVNMSGRLRHPLEAAHTVGELIEALT